MELIRLLRILLRRWWLIVIPVAIACVFVFPQFLNQGAAVSGGFATQIRYTAAQELNLPETDSTYQDVWIASEYVAFSFTEWVRSSSFRAEIATVLNDESINMNAVFIAPDTNRSINSINMGYGDADALQKVADAAIEVLQTRSQAYFPNLGGDAAQVSILDMPVVTPAPPPVANRFAPFIQLGLALIAGVGLAVLADYFDPTLYRRDDRVLHGLPILASIPRHKQEG
ncbi:MAG: hypothetical protein ACPG7F_20705 [Aggregatilineales bacterium]